MTGADEVMMVLKRSMEGERERERGEDQGEERNRQRSSSKYLCCVSSNPADEGRT